MAPQTPRCPAVVLSWQRPMLPCSQVSKMCEELDAGPVELIHTDPLCVCASTFPLWLSGQLPSMVGGCMVLTRNVNLVLTYAERGIPAGIMLIIVLSVSLRMPCHRPGWRLTLTCNLCCHLDSSKLEVMCDVRCQSRLSWHSCSTLAASSNEVIG